MLLILVLLQYTSGNSYPVQFYDLKIIRNLHSRVLVSVLSMNLSEDEVLLQKYQNKINTVNDKMTF